MMATLTKRLTESAFWNLLRISQETILLVCNVVLMAMLGAVIIARYILNVDIFGYDEIILIAAYWMYFIGSSYASYENSHLKADMLTKILPESLTKWVKVLTGSLEVFLGLVFTLWSMETIQYAVEKMPRTSSWRIPLAVPQGAILVGFGLMTFYSMFHLVDYISETFIGNKEA